MSRLSNKNVNISLIISLLITGRGDISDAQS